MKNFYATASFKKAFCCVTILSIALCAAPPSSLGGWELVFEDEFDGTSLDLSKWNPTYNWGSTHNHAAYCVPENVSVKEGKLIIKGEAKRHPDAPPTATNGGNTYQLEYTSGAIDTRGKFGVKYGYIEGRFKAPAQLGTWPAFWTLQDGWPPEIDILEIPHERNLHHYYLHYTDPSWYSEHGSAWDHEKSFGGTSSGPDKSKEFYNYGVEWDENNLNFYFDDKIIARYNRPTEIKQLGEQYIIINLAIGGWVGTNIEVTADNPAFFEAEWVRVWKRKNTDTKEKIRLRSVAKNKCLMEEENALVLGDCNSENAFFELENLGGSLYRFNFGDRVLEIPNESTEAGAFASLYSWNGKDHQKINVEVQNGFEGTVVRLKMNHSSHYLRASENEDRALQDWNTAWEWHQNWEILRGEIPKDTSTTFIKTPNFNLQNKTLIKVYNIKGDKILELQGELETLKSNLKNFPAGIYQVRVYTNKNSKTFRVFNN